VGKHQIEELKEIKMMMITLITRKRKCFFYWVVITN